jgi:hypothetical protein
MNYKNLVAMRPTECGSIVNSTGQEIVFVEHPLKGDEYPVIAVCHALEVAATTDFFDLDDMVADHKEYEPWFNEDKELIYG